MNGCTNARIGAAAANVGHGRINVLVGGLGLFLQECNRCQHLTALAVTALWHLMVNPRLLDRMQFAFVCQALNGDDFLTSRY
jgi:hypothetical protein